MTFNVMVTCDDGTHRRAADGWERGVHTITFATYNTWEEAERVALDMSSNPTVRMVWIQPSFYPIRRDS